MGLKSQPKLNRHTDERLVKGSDQNTQGVRRSKSRRRMNKTGFPKTKRPGFSSPYLLFVICESTRVTFFSAIRTQNKITESRAKFHKSW